MTKETEVALAAIDALCKKRKAKALRKLVMRAVESERSVVGIYGGVSGVTIADHSGTTSTPWSNGDDTTIVNT